MKKQTPHPLTKLDGCINTPSGKISLISPDPKDINIVDISCGLANNCHFGGLVHPNMYFSIASHSLLVVQLAAEKNTNPMFLMTCLLHDAAEAYLGDVKKPMKVLDGMETYRRMEREFTLCICDAFDLEILQHEVKPFDRKAQEIEYATFYKGAELIQRFDSPVESHRRFLQTFYYLQYQCSKILPVIFTEQLIPIRTHDLAEDEGGWIC